MFGIRSLAFAPIVVGLVLAMSGCQDGPANPYTTGGGGFGAGGAGGAGGSTIDPELGGPCEDDAQCDDEVSCTYDACDQSIKRCRFKTDDTVCANTVHCDGAELCDRKLGCQPGPPTDCGDENVCTIDRCIEETRSCERIPRDADGDGDPDAHCGGGDCDDFDPFVSTLEPEVCGDMIDNDCNQSVDESGCLSPEHDTCLDPLEISAAGTFTLSTFGATFDYAHGCSMPSFRDVVAAIVLPAGPPRDVVVTARSTTTDVTVALAGQCGAPATEIACGHSFFTASGDRVSKIRARGLGDPAMPTALPLYVSTALGANVTLTVAFEEPATSAPTNETCGTAADLPLGVPTEVELLEVLADHATECPSLLGDRLYRFTLTSAANVDVFAASVDGVGQPSISLRADPCTNPEDELTCAANLAPHLFRNDLPPGDYYVALSATAPTVASLTVLTSPPTASPADEDCTSPPSLTPGVTDDVSFALHQDDVSLGCFGAATDAVRTLTIAQPSDVLLVQRMSAGDSGSVQLSAPACSDPSDLVACAFGAKSPNRLQKRNLAPGDYRVVIESILGSAAQITAFVRPSTPAVIVPFADACANVLDIPASGGFFQGNTSSASADFSAGCDFSSIEPFGARDQLLRLTLPSEKRVVFDMTGSQYDTLLDVRTGATCPGTEVPLGCSLAYPGQTSFLDLTLAAGTYYVQIDGAGAAQSGLWRLDVHVADP